MDLLVNHFDDFAEHRYDKIIAKTGCTQRDLKEAMDVISQLNPHPGDGIDFSDKDFVIPDVCIEQKSGNWVIILNDSSLPITRMNQHYLDIYRNSS